jgi:hypothetical protein
MRLYVTRTTPLSWVLEREDGSRWLPNPDGDGLQPYTGPHEVLQEVDAQGRTVLRLLLGDLVGPAEIAARAGVQPDTFFEWRRRYPDFPKPAVQLKMGPVWFWADVAPWLAKHPGRPGRPGRPAAHRSVGRDASAPSHRSYQGETWILDSPEGV